MKNNLSILNIKLDNLDRYQGIARVEELFKKKSSSLICTVNTEFIMRAQIDEEFMKTLNHKSSLNLIDGSGVIWAATFQNIWIPQSKIIRHIYAVMAWILSLIFYPIIIFVARRSVHKTSGADIVWDICRWASDNDKSIFILGNKYGLDTNSVQKASLELQTNIYGLKIAGTHSSSDEESNEKADIEMIKKSGADILFCAFGSPSQELWLAKNLSRTGAKIGIGLGGTFDFIAGVQKRAPRFISAIGFEWLWRLISHPRRARRQLALPRFAFAILRECLIRTSEN